MDNKGIAFEKMTELSENASDENDIHKSLFGNQVRYVLHRFADRTSMHGCGFIKTSSHRWSRFCWSSLTFIATFVLIIHLYMITSDFIEWPKKTDVSLEFSNLRFPAVTICNVNALRKNAISTIDNRRLKLLIATVNPESLLKAMDFEHDTKASGLGVENRSKTSGEPKRKSISDMYNFDWNKFDYGDDTSISFKEGDTEENTDQGSLAKVMNVYRLLLMQLPKEERATSGHNISNMLLDCIFNGRLCYSSDFTLYQTASFGNCYTLDSDRMFVQRPGPDGGLSLLLFLQTDEFIEGITDGFGAKVIVHEPGTVPLPDDDGVFVSAATETDIAIKRTEIRRLGWPYGKCETGQELKENFRLNYTVKLCHAVCQAVYIVEKCRCWHHMYELISEHTEGNFNICSTSKERRCVNRASDAYYKKEYNCECKNPCSDAQYYLSLSSRQWPSQSFVAILKAHVCFYNPEECDAIKSFSTLQELQKNFIHLKIYYETLNFESIVEKPLIDPFTFMSSIGGALGLWIGLSMLSFCEVLQLVAELIMCLVSKCTNRRMTK